MRTKAIYKCAPSKVAERHRVFSPSMSLLVFALQEFGTLGRSLKDNSPAPARGADAARTRSRCGATLSCRMLA
jgi:hypothetical protein